jgi:hypothetical protein
VRCVCNHYLKIIEEDNFIGVLEEGKEDDEYHAWHRVMESLGAIDNKLKPNPNLEIVLENSLFFWCCFLYSYTYCSYHSRTSFHTDYLYLTCDDCKEYNHN